MKDCNDIQLKLLSGRDAEIEAHLTSCADCAEFAETLANTAGLLEIQEPSLALDEAVLSAAAAAVAPAKPKPAPILQFAGWLAAAAAIVLMFTVMVTPQDPVVATGGSELPTEQHDETELLSDLDIELIALMDQIETEEYEAAVAVLEAAMAEEETELDNEAYTAESELDAALMEFELSLMLIGIE
jgi:predicted anti-sigma-YlaC factor YlaD